MQKELKSKLLLSTTIVMISFSYPSVAEITRGKSSPMAMDLGYGIVVNKRSSLIREWSVVNDDLLPVKLTYFRGVTPILDDRWEYNAKFSIQVIEPISAVEVRFIPFNVWGEKDRTLTMTEISDLDVGLHELDAKWRTFENDAVEHFASLAYVAAVRLSSGRIIRADLDHVVEAAREFSQDFTAGDLEKDKD